MTEKIDTQGMSGEAVKGCTDNVYPRDANGNPIYPPFNPLYFGSNDGWTFITGAGKASGFLITLI